MPLYQLGSLYDRIAQHMAAGTSMPEADVLALFRGVCEGVGEFHRKKRRHGDIKPDNILIGDDDRPVLMDFGMYCLPSTTVCPQLFALN
jgi:serine/threonine-protein kinase